MDLSHQSNYLLFAEYEMEDQCPHRLHDDRHNSIGMDTIDFRKNSHSRYCGNRIVIVFPAYHMVAVAFESTFPFRGYFRRSGELYIHVSVAEFIGLILFIKP